MDILEKNEHFFDLWARVYDHGPIAWWLRTVQKKAMTTIHPKEGDLILDASCGTGHALKALHGSGAQLVGIDLSDNMLLRAKKNLTNIDVTLLKANVQKIPFADKHFDYVISTEAFHHYPNQEQALCELYRILKPGGELVLVDIEFVILPIHRLFETIEPGCVHVNSRREIRKLVDAAGFHKITQKRLVGFSVATYAHRPVSSTKDL